MIQVANLGLSEETEEALAKRGIFAVFPVQKQVREHCVYEGLCILSEAP